MSDGTRAVTAAEEQQGRTVLRTTAGVLLVGVLTTLWWLLGMSSAHAAGLADGPGDALRGALRPVASAGPAAAREVREKAEPASTPSVAAPVRQLTRTAAGTVRPVTAPVRPVTRTVTEKTQPATRTVTEKAQPVTRTVTEKAQPVARTVTEKTQPATRAVTAPVRPVTRTVTEKTQPATRALTETVRPVTRTVTETVAPTVHVVAGATRGAVTATVRQVLPTVRDTVGGAVRDTVRATVPTVGGPLPGPPGGSTSLPPEVSVGSANPALDTATTGPATTDGTPRHTDLTRFAGRDGRDRMATARPSTTASAQVSGTSTTGGRSATSSTVVAPRPIAPLVATSAASSDLISADRVTPGTLLLGAGPLGHSALVTGVGGADPHAVVGHGLLVPADGPPAPPRSRDDRAVPAPDLRPGFAPD